MFTGFKIFIFKLQIDKAKNAKFVKTADLPEHLRSLLERWESGEEEKRKKKEYEDSLVKVLFLIDSKRTDLDFLQFFECRFKLLVF